MFLSCCNCFWIVCRCISATYVILTQPFPNVNTFFYFLFIGHNSSDIACKTSKSYLNEFDGYTSYERNTRLWAKLAAQQWESNELAFANGVGYTVTIGNSSSITCINHTQQCELLVCSTSVNNHYLISYMFLNLFACFLSVST